VTGSETSLKNIRKTVETTSDHSLGRWLRWNPTLEDLRNAKYPLILQPLILPIAPLPAAGIPADAEEAWSCTQPLDLLPARSHGLFMLERLFRVVNVIGFDDQRDRNVFAVGPGLSDYFFDTASMYLKSESRGRSMTRPRICTSE